MKIAPCQVIRSTSSLYRLSLRAADGTSIKPSLELAGFSEGEDAVLVDKASLFNLLKGLAEEAKLYSCHEEKEIFQGAMDALNAGAPVNLKFVEVELETEPQ